MADQCKATTKKGARCGNPAGDDGYCHISSHGPEKVDGQRAHARKHEPEEVADALRRKDGVVRDAVKVLDIGKSRVYEYINEFEVCERAKEEGAHHLVDLSRSTLRQAMLEGDLDAARHVSRHYDRDAKTQQDVTSNDQPIGSAPEALEDLTTEELRALADEPDDDSEGGS